MKSNKKLGHIIGILLLCVMAAGIPSTLFRGLSTSLAQKPEFLQLIFDQSMQMRFVVLLSFITSAVWMVIIALLFPLVKKFNYSMALVFLILWITLFGVNLYGDLSHLSLLSLSKEAIGASNSILENFNALGLLKVKDYLWSHFFALILYTSAMMLFYFYLFKTKMVPRILSVWGLLAVGLVFTAAWLNVLDRSVSMYVYYHNGLHMTTFIIWLLVKGFKPLPTDN